jgi:DNA-binding MurR/RpiR family transcriptional regulator
MESLKLRVTLTNTKWWKETKDVHLSHYLSQKEEGNDVLDKIVEQLIQDYERMGKNMNENKIENQKWRP